MQVAHLLTFAKNIRTRAEKETQAEIFSLKALLNAKLGNNDESLQYCQQAESLLSSSYSNVTCIIARFLLEVH